MALVNGWARQDAAAATDYVFGLPGGRNNARMMRILAGEQVRQDPRGAGPWALGLPEGELRVAAIDEVATRWVLADGPAAIDWVASMGLSGEMPETMTSAMGIWARTDPEGASPQIS